MIKRNALKAVFTSSLKLKPTESCLIVTDTIKEPIGRAFYEYAKNITPRSKIMVMNPTKEHGSEPPEEIASEMLKYDVEILVTEKSLTHTRARRDATKKGSRIATMPSIIEDIINRCLDIDYEDLKNKSSKLCDILAGAKTIHVLTSKGTDITFTVGKGSFFGKEGGVFDYPSAFGNLPEGEVSFSPESCEGVYVVDASFPGLGLLDSPITFRVTSGTVEKITGSRADEIIERLDRIGPKAYRIAELGIGLNSKAKIIGNILEDEKVIGTVHIAVGNNLSYGGDNDVPLHLDGVIAKPTVFVDDKKLMDNGRFVESME